MNNHEQVIRSHITLATVDYDDGDIVSAQDHARQALATVGDNLNLKAVVLQVLGDLKMSQSDLAGARQSYEDSLALSRQLKIQQYSADAEFNLADIAREQGDFAAAHRYLDSALEFYTRQNQKNQLWDSALTLANIQISEGHAAATEKTIEDAAAGFHALHAPVRELAAYTALARSWLAQHKPLQARAAIQHGRPAFLVSHEFQARMQYRLLSAQVSAATGDRPAARRDLQALLVELESKSWSLLAAKARHALADIRP